MNLKDSIVIAFVGDSENMLDICRFVSVVFNDENKKVLVVDSSSQKELYYNILGETDCRYTIYRGITYTNDVSVMKRDKNKFDIILLYVNEPKNNIMLFSVIDMVFFCYGRSRQSYEKLCTVLSKDKTLRKEIKKRVCCLLYRGEEGDMSVEYIQHLLGGVYFTYFVPKCDKDMSALNKMDYGLFDRDSLSGPLTVFLNSFQNIKVVCGGWKRDGIFNISY